MDRAKQREIASKGGKAAHQKGTAHEWTSEEARDAGRKGGIASHRVAASRLVSADPARVGSSADDTSDDEESRAQNARRSADDSVRSRRDAQIPGR